MSTVRSAGSSTRSACCRSSSPVWSPCSTAMVTGMVHMIAAMPEPPVRAAQEEERRPALLLAVYSWDMFLAILAIFGALAPFAGQVALGPRQLEVPLPLQVVAALSSAAYAGVLIIIASLLTRRYRWVQRLQIVTMGLEIAI